jgi:hypothetical protein
MTEKKKLRMLPEVLPRPTSVAGPSNVRARALARLSVLAAMAAASSGCGGKGGEGGEGGPYGVVDPLPYPTGGGRDRNDPLPPVGTGGADDRVDPPRQPAVCFDGGLLVGAEYVSSDGLDAGAPAFAAPDAAAVDASVPDAAAADAGPPGAGSGNVQIELTVFSPVYPGTVGRADSLTPGVQIVSQSEGGAGQAHTLLILVPAGTRFASIELPIVCGNRADRYRVDLVLQTSSVQVTVQPE